MHKNSKIVHWSTKRSFGLPLVSFTAWSNAPPAAVLARDQPQAGVGTMPSFAVRLTSKPTTPDSSTARLRPDQMKETVTT